MTSVRTGAALLVATLVVACSGGSATTTSSPPEALVPSPTATPASTPALAVPSNSPHPSKEASVVVGGDRPATVAIPRDYDRGHPAPLLILLHGYGSSGREHDMYFHLGDLAAERGYLYVHPDGTLDGGGNHFWNATDACCDFDGKGIDDAAYLAGVISEIETRFAVDPKRIDVIGHSNGGFMSYALACSHADTVAAIASLAGATFAKPADCAPTSPVAVLEIHGTADDTILYKGGTIDLGSGRSMGAYPGAETSVATWATYDGCTKTSLVDEHVDVDADITADGANAEATVTRWSGCKPGGAAELWTIPGGGHGPDISEAFPAAVLDFFAAHPKE
jgi:polyhydroxybutyrate depolymerase